MPWYYSATYLLVTGGGSCLPPNPKLKKHLLSAVRDCLFNIFAAIVHSLGALSSVRANKMRTSSLTFQIETRVTQNSIRTRKYISVYRPEVPKLWGPPRGG
jgi:hypothetical protein